MSFIEVFVSAIVLGMVFSYYVASGFYLVRWLDTGEELYKMVTCLVGASALVGLISLVVQ